MAKFAMNKVSTAPEHFAHRTAILACSGQEHATAERVGKAAWMMTGKESSTGSFRSRPCDCVTSATSSQPPTGFQLPIDHRLTHNRQGP
jgi:hypothetical protein